MSDNLETKDDLEARIRERLEDLRKYLEADGGNLEIIEIKDKNVKLKLTGACGCCPHAGITLKDGIEKNLREYVDPEIVVSRAEN